VNCYSALGPDADRRGKYLILLIAVGSRDRADSHFQFSAPEGLAYSANRYRREAERHYQVINDHLAGREFIVGDSYTIADMSAWGCVLSRN
jgi:GST-like protein